MAKEAFKLLDFNIVSLSKYEGSVKSGRNQGNPYVKFVFKTHHSKAGDQEFQYFADPKASETWPYEGVRVKEMEGLLGTYQGNIQYDVKTLLYYQEAKKQEDDFPAPEEKAPSGVRPSTDSIGKECSVCTSYAMELTKALINGGMNASQIDEALPLVCDSVARNGYILYATLKASMEKERAIK